MSETALRSYLGKIEQEYRKGDATEHSYRPAFKDLLDTLGHSQQISATNEPKRGRHGAPDYRVVRQQGNNRFTIGYVEAKDIDKALGEEEKSEQLQRYRGNLQNLILTDYLEFRWYLNGEHRKTVRLAHLGAGGRFTLEKDGLHDVEQLLQAFLGTRAEPISQPRDLAERMARLTRMIRDTVVKVFDEGEAPAALRDLHQAFQEVLIPNLSVPYFADMFAQTLAYGLFAARYNHNGAEPFRRQDATREIPKTNPFLRKLFNTISGADLDDESFMRFVDDLAQLLAQADMGAILRGFGKSTRQEDPVVHFYETFLTAYDPKLRELRGVYYTPEPVVSYIVRSVDSLLKTHFNCPNGLAERISAGKPRVLLLDPACGTGTFSYMVINLIRERFREQHQAGMWSAYVREHLLPRLFSFELLMAPYAVAHLKLGMQLAGLDLPEAERANWAYDFQSEERLGIYLTNTLEEAAKRSQMLLGGYISDEANEAARVKKDEPVMVVLGNPPYSGHSANKGEWITRLLRGEEVLQGKGKKAVTRPTDNYFMVDGQPLGERNPKWVNNDYVKFIRFAQWRIEQTGYGILAFITDHGYLDNPTFRGIRQSLMQTFDEIYVLDLHGSSKKKEHTPDGGKDENVFDIQQGVAIGIFVKHSPTQAAQATAIPPATVHHADLWGMRASKYARLAEQDITSTEWKTVSPQSSFYLFVPQNGDWRAEYEEGWKVTKAMPVNVLGFQTHRDHFAIDIDEAKLRARISEMRDKTLSDQDYTDKYALTDNRDWQLSKARQVLRSDPVWQSHLIRCLYRPFDRRPCYFSEVAMDYPRRELLEHVEGKQNLCLLSSRQQATLGYRHSWVAREPANDCVISTTSREANQVFPLYLYPDTTKGDLWGDNRRANFAQAFIDDFRARLGMAWVEDGKGDRQQTFGPEDVFSYMYAILHAPTYRERYAEFLKIDFPRLPLTSNVDLFWVLCALGDELVRMHLLEGDVPLITSYPERGNDRVENVRYTDPIPGSAQGRVYINNTQYFDGVPPEVWAFHVGGYQVCQKWLKDRKGRTLTFNEIEHYQKTVAALNATIRLMDEIDDAIEEHGGWPIA
jgi:predicted helicase